jgi:NRPS condensation-like uncharacterized protein
LYWEASEDLEPTITWCRGGSECESSTTRLDLLKEPASRFLIESDPAQGRADLRIQFHHACCDGIGIFQFLRDLLVMYHFEAAQAKGQPPLAELSADRLRLRGRTGLTQSELIKIAPRQAIGLIGAKEFLTRRPVPLLPHDPVGADATVPECYPNMVVHQLSVEETTNLTAKARRFGATLNDVMIRDLFLALIEFRENHMTSQSDDWLRVMIPMNIRNRFHRHISAANMVSSVFIDRRPSDVANPQSLLEGICAQMKLIKRNRLGLTFLASLQLLNWFPGGLKKQARKQQCSISCIFSNLGRVFNDVPVPAVAEQLVVAGSTIESIEVSVPNRPYNCVSFASLTYAQRLSISLHYDPRVLSREQGGGLLRSFVRHLNSME